MKSRSLTALAMALGIHGACQSPGSGDSLLIGKWKLQKHRTFEAGKKIYQPLFKGMLVRYQFNKGGTYERFDSSEYGIGRIAGNWRLTNGGKTIELYNAQDVPHHPGDSFRDYRLYIQTLNRKELIVGNDVEMVEADTTGVGYYIRIGK